MDFETEVEERIFLKKLCDSAQPLREFLAENANKNLTVIVSHDKIKIFPNVYDCFFEKNRKYITM